MGHSGRKYGYYHCPRKNCRYSIRHELAADVLTGFLRDESVPSGVLSLFTEVVENARRQRHDASNRLRNQSQLKLDQLAEKREKLSEALIYRNAIDKATYDAQIVKLDEAERLAREEINDLTRSVPNIAEAVARGQQLLGDLPALWEHLDPAPTSRLPSSDVPSRCLFRTRTDSNHAKALVPARSCCVLGCHTR